MTEDIIRKLDNLCEKIESGKDAYDFFFNLERYVKYIADTPEAEKLVRDENREKLFEGYRRFQFLVDADRRESAIKDVWLLDRSGSPTHRQEVVIFNDALVSELMKLKIKVDRKPKRSDMPIDKTPQKTLKSIDLIGDSADPQSVIRLVYDREFQAPISYDAKNRYGKDTAIKKLYNLAYPVNVADKKVDYDEDVMKSINNDIFKKRRLADYVKSHDIKKPTLVGKSAGNTLILKNEVPVKTLRPAEVPAKWRSLYMDKDH